MLMVRGRGHGVSEYELVYSTGRMIGQVGTGYFKLTIMFNFIPRAKPGASASYIILSTVISN